MNKLYIYFFLNFPKIIRKNFDWFFLFLNEIFSALIDFKLAQNRETQYSSQQSDDSDNAE